MPLHRVHFNPVSFVVQELSNTFCSPILLDNDVCTHVHLAHLQVTGTCSRSARFDLGALVAHIMFTYLPCTPAFRGSDVRTKAQQASLAFLQSVSDFYIKVCVTGGGACMLQTSAPAVFLR